MKTIVVDDEVVALKMFLYEAEMVSGIEMKGAFQSPLEALQYASRNEVELAILDVEMPEMDGILLGQELRKNNPDIMLVYISNQEKYAMEAFRLHAAGYLMKPYTKEELQYAVESAYLLSKRKKKKIYARTFGYFDLFVDEKPVMFKSAKAKELLAYLIDRRGGIVTSEQIINVLWEDRPNDEATQNLCSKIVKTLKKELKEIGAENMLISSRGNKRVDIQVFDCDLYDFLEGKKELRERYIGEYLLDYSWAENRTAQLDKYIQDIG